MVEGYPNHVCRERYCNSGKAWTVITFNGINCYVILTNCCVIYHYVLPIKIDPNLNNRSPNKLSFTHPFNTCSTWGDILPTGSNKNMNMIIRPSNNLFPSPIWPLDFHHLTP